MLIYPAIDLYQGKAVRLYKGDYARMTVYSDDPASIAEDFARCGATHMHIVDLEGAKSGTTPNYETILEIKRRGGLFCEVGGGIRSMQTIDRYLSAGIDRVILGTAAVTEPGFVEEAVTKYGDKLRWASTCGTASSPSRDGPNSLTSPPLPSAKSSRPSA